MPQLCVPGSQLWLESQDKHGNKSKADCLRAPARGNRQCDASFCGSEVRCTLETLGLMGP